MSADERKPGESFCADCPDHEGCMTGYPCDLVKRVNAPQAHTPGSLEAIVNQLSDLIAEWHAAENDHLYAPASEKDDARGVADEAKDVVYQYVSHILGGA